MLHFITGTYHSLYQKSRLAELAKTFFTTLFGCLFLLFFFILKNPHENNHSYYLEFFSLLIPVFTLKAVARTTFLNIVKSQINNNKVYFNTLLIGSPKKAVLFYKDFISSKAISGYRITSFLHTGNQENFTLPESIKTYANFSELNNIITEQEIEEVVITIEKNDRALISQILQQLSDKEVNIKITPDTVDIITGALQTNNVLGVPMIDIHAGMLPEWQQNIKRSIDILIAVFALIILSPLFIYSIIRVRFSSSGNIFY